MGRRKCNIGRRQRSVRITREKKLLAKLNNRETLSVEKFGSNVAVTNTNLVGNTSDVQSPPATESSLVKRKKKCDAESSVSYFKCKICHVTFGLENELRIHMLKYKDSRYECEVCKTRFSNRQQLRHHSSNAHGKFNSQFTEQCKICTQGFAWAFDLRLHLFHCHRNLVDTAEFKNSLVNFQMEANSAETEHPCSIQDSAKCNSDSTETIEKKEKGAGSIGVTAQALEPRLENRGKDDKDKRDKQSTENSHEVSAKKKCLRLPMVQITRVDRKKFVNPHIKSSSMTERETPFSNKIVYEPENTNVKTIMDTEKNLNNCVSTEARSSENTTVAPSIDSQQNPTGNTAEKHDDKACNYEKEMKLRKLFSCKECYLPLIRLKVPGKSAESGKTKASQPLVTETQAAISSMICDKIFVSEATMMQHFQQQHFKYSNGEVFCVCDDKLNESDVLPYHLYRYCRKIVVPTARLSDSSVPCKPLVKYIACLECGDRFWLESCLKNHIPGCKSSRQRKKKQISESPKSLPATNNYDCKVCRTQFSSSELLLEHQKKYSRPSILPCTFCATMFPTDGQLVYHIRMTHLFNTKPNYRYVCTICSQPFKSQVSERIHRMHIHQNLSRSDGNNEVARNDCYECDDPEDTAPTVNKCNGCNLVFSSKKRFIEHTIYYAKNEIIRCKVCNKKFEGQYKAHHHNKEVHYPADTSSAFTHRCNVCKEGFMFMIHLQAHVFHVHLSENIITTVDQNGSDGTVTDTLQNDSPLADSWMDQLRDRDPETRPPSGYACNVCDIRFPTPTDLAKHQMEFRDDNEYLCNRCSKKCPDSATLVNHLSLNHYGKALQSSVKCARCDQEFASKTDWVSHAKHVHKITEPPEFYLEHNMLAVEESKKMKYALIPTNKSILRGLTYSRIKRSINNPTEEAERSDTNVLVSKDSHDIRMKEKTIDAKTISVPLPHEKKSSTNVDDQSVTTNLIIAQNQIKTHNPMPKKARTVRWDIRRVADSPAGKGWNCSLCNNVFYDPYLLAEHVGMYADCGHHVCVICGRRFNTAELYSKHKLGHVCPQNMKFPCGLCKEGFDTYQDMRMHVAHIHPESLAVLPSESNAKDSAHEDKTALKPVKQSRSEVRLQQSPTRSSAVAYSRKRSNQSPTVIDLLDDDVPKLVKVVAPAPQIEIIEDKKSANSEPPQCRGSFSISMQTAEDVTIVDKFIDNDKNPGKTPQISDGRVTCHICDKIFANQTFLDMHKERRHFVRPVEPAEKKVPNNVGVTKVSCTNTPHLEILTVPTVEKGTQAVVQLLSQGAGDVQLVSQPPKGTTTVIVQRPTITERAVQLISQGADDPQLVPQASKGTTTVIVQRPKIMQRAVQLISQGADDLQLVLQAPKRTTPVKVQRPKITRRILPKPPTELQTPTVVEHKRSATPQEKPDNVKGRSVLPHNETVVKLSVPSKVAPSLIASTAALIKPVEITEVLLDDSPSGTPDSTVHCHYLCCICGIIFMNENQLAEHEKRAHSSTIPASRSDDNSMTKAISARNPIKDLDQLVSTLPVQTSNMDYMDAPLHFESVLIPVSARDLERFEDENQVDGNNDRVINPLDDSLKNNPPSNNSQPAKLKVRPFAKILENLSKRKALKRKQPNGADGHKTESAKGVFNREIYENLCRQHNLKLPSNSRGSKKH